MYLDYWGLREKPFQNTSDPRFLCLSEQHEEALSRMQYCVNGYYASMLLTGVFGSGKTLLAQALIDQLPRERFTTAFIFNPQFGNVEILREILYQLGVHDRIPEQKSDILHRLNDLLSDSNAEGRHTVIMIDEAHLIEDRLIFEELRLLMNFQKRDRFLLTLILIGQPELREKIINLKQFDQRISMRYHLKGLKPAETESYVLHRLQIAGASREIFDPRALAMIHESTGGIPRRINQICDLSLLAGFGARAERITEDILKDVVMDPQAT